jgi:hypothetical protein
MLKCTGDPTGGAGLTKNDGGWGATVEIFKRHEMLAAFQPQPPTGGTLNPNAIITSYKALEISYQASLSANGPTVNTVSPGFSFSIAGASVHTCKEQNGIQVGFNPITWGERSIVSMACGGIPLTSGLAGVAPPPPIGDPPGTVTATLESTRNTTGVTPQIKYRPTGSTSGTVTFLNVYDEGSGTGVWNCVANSGGATVGGKLNSKVKGLYGIGLGTPSSKITDIQGYFTDAKGALGLVELQRDGFEGSFGPISCSWNFGVIRRKVRKEPGSDNLVILEDWKSVN